MPLDELDALLRKDEIIATYQAQSLRSVPGEVEQVYRTHARTHIAVGDTADYVERIFQWVSGSKKGAFVGGVIGDYGHGKTSFQVHVWDQATARGIFAVPPFSWDRVSEMVDGVAGWVAHIMDKTDRRLAEEADRLYHDFREKSLQEVAQEIAEKSMRSVDEVLSSLHDAEKYGGVSLVTEVTPERFLEYCASITEMVERVGFKGFLVLLDEPERAAKGLGTAKVAQILFDLANGLLQRTGNFGVFISLPENFVASIQTGFSSLLARLQGRSCLPRLRDVYGPDFAQTLWERFAEEFSLGVEGTRILVPETLVALGQIASSERRDLSYGPRSVVSAFRRMAWHYRETGQAYTPEDLVQDCLLDEIRVMPDYCTRVRQCLASPEAATLDKRLLTRLAAFPNGLTVEQARSLEIDEAFLDSTRKNGLTSRRGNVCGLRILQKGPGLEERDHLREAIGEIFDEFAPSPAAFTRACEAFIAHILPRILERRQGQQLLGWDYPAGWDTLKDLIKMGEFTGAFRQTEKEFPKRRLLVTIGPAAYDIVRSDPEPKGEDLGPDIHLKFCLRWYETTSLPEQHIEIDPGDPLKGKPATIQITLDLAEDPIPLSGLAVLNELVDSRLFTALGLLNLMGEMDRRALTKEYEGAWEAIRVTIIREIVARFFVDSPIREQVSLQLGQDRDIGGGAGDLLGTTCLQILRSRYPDYSTLIRQPHWTEKIDSYIRALGQQDIPLACKRGREPWIVRPQIAAQFLGTNVMNLPDAFAGYENIISIRTGRRDSDATVVFNIHPLEKRIMDQVMSAKPPHRLRIDDKECTWWLDEGTLTPLLLCSGYQVEEVRMVVSVGKARGTFASTTQRGQRILYCLPLDIEQMKMQLREETRVLSEETESLKRLPVFTTSFDFVAVSGEIDELQDEGGFESLRARLNKESEQNHGRLPGYFDKAVEQFREISRESSEARDRLHNSRLVRGLQELPTGSSKWCADFGEYIVANLKRLVDGAIEKHLELVNEASAAADICEQKRQGDSTERIRALLDARALFETLRERQTALKEELKGVNAYLDAFDHWTRVLTLSDEVYAKLLDLKEEEFPKVRELLSQLDAVWARISKHLKTRNVLGLSSYNQYRQEIESIEKARNTHVGEVASTFNRWKEHLNGVLESLDLGSDSRCAEVFNPADAKGSYDRALRQSVGHIERVCEAERRSMADEKREVLFAQHVLNRLPDELGEHLTRELEDATKALQGEAKAVSSAWLTAMARSEEPVDTDSAVGNLKLAIGKARVAVRETKKTIRGAQPTGQRELSPIATDLLKLIPIKESVDLKQVILGMIGKGYSATEVLDKALEVISDLFRGDKVKIGVGLPER